MSNNTVASNIHRFVKSYSEKINKSEEVSNLMTTGIEASEEIKRGPLFMMLALEEVLGDEMDALPIPDSLGGNNPDKYTEEVVIDGRKSPKKGSFYNDLFRSLKVGQEIEDVLANVKLAIDKSESALEEYTRMSENVIKQVKKRYEQRRTNGRNLLKKAAALHHQVRSIKEFDQVKFAWQTVEVDGKKIYSNTTVPITLFDNSNAPDSWGRFDNMTIPQFLALDLKTAKEKGGSYDVVKSTRYKATAPTENNTKKMDMAGLEDVLADIATMVDTFEDEKKVTAKIMAKLAQPSEENDHLILSMGKAYLFLDSIYHHIEKRYNQLNGDATEKVANS